MITTFFLGFLGVIVVSGLGSIGIAQIVPEPYTFAATMLYSAAVGVIGADIIWKYR